MSTVTRTEGTPDDAGSSSGDEHWYLLLAFSHEEDTSERLTELDHWLSRRGQRRLRRVDFGVDVPAGEDAGALVFGGAVRSLELRRLLDLLAEMPWSAPDDVQLMVREPGDVRWAVVPAVARGRRARD